MQPQRKGIQIWSLRAIWKILLLVKTHRNSLYHRPATLLDQRFLCKSILPASLNMWVLSWPPSQWRRVKEWFQMERLRPLPASVSCMHLYFLCYLLLESWWVGVTFGGILFYSCPYLLSHSVGLVNLTSLITLHLTYFHVNVSPCHQGVLFHLSCRYQLPLEATVADWVAEFISLEKGISVEPWPLLRFFCSLKNDKMYEKLATSGSFFQHRGLRFNVVVSFYGPVPVALPFLLFV